MTEPSGLLSAILDRGLSLEERKGALETLISSGDPNLQQHLEQILSCDSSVLRFRARRELKFMEEGGSQPEGDSDETPPAAEARGIPVEKSREAQPQSIKKVMSAQTRRLSGSAPVPVQQHEDERADGNSKAEISEKFAHAVTFVAENRKLVLQVASYSLLFGVAIGIVSMIIGHLGKESRPRTAIVPTAESQPVAQAQSGPAAVPSTQARETPEKLFESAQVSFNGGNLREAEKNLLAILSSRDRETIDTSLTHRASLLLSRVKLGLGDQAEAGRLLEGMEPGSPEDFVTLARYRMAVRDYNGCLTAAEEALAIDPFDADAPRLGFDAAVEADNRDKAGKFLAVIQEREPDTPETLSLAMEFFFSGGEAEKFLAASDKYRKIARETSKDLIRRGKCFKAVGKLKSAAINLDKARAMDPSLRKDPEFLYDLALLFNEVGNIDKAFLHYRQAVNLNGEILLRTEGGILDTARTSFETIHALSPDAPNILLQMGWVEYLTGNLEIAKTHFKRVTELVDSGPMRTQADEMLGNLANISLTQAGKPGSLSVSEAPETDIEEEPDPEAGDEDGDEGGKPKKPDKPRQPKASVKAGELFKPWIPVEVPQDKMEQADAHYRRGMIYFDSENWQEATEELKAAFDLNPNDKETILRVAEVYHNKLHMNPEAIEAYKRYLPLDPQNQNIYVNIGQLLVKEERPDEAVPWLDGAIAADPGSSMAKYCAKIKSLVLKKVGPQGD